MKTAPMNRDRPKKLNFSTYIPGWPRFVQRIVLCCGVLLVAMPSCTPDKAPPVVNSVAGEWLGSWSGANDTIAAFRGIPFAQPPVGVLRWRAPLPTIVQGRQDATEYAPACVQGSGMVDWYADVAAAFGAGPEVVGRPAAVSEDCLYLNIWSPRLKAGEKLPVMVYVHGGSNVGGWSYEPNYVGENLAARGVVVVSISYRLGPFGFFAHPALDNGPGEAAANFALLDIRAAFEWVSANIGAFGGDPENITGFGESAGAFDLVDLMLAELAAGKGGQPLFRRVISQSIGGPVLNRRTLADEQDVGVFLAGELGMGPGASADQLRAIPAQALLEATETLPGDHYFSAVVDAITMPRHPLDVLTHARAGGVDLMIGTNADEWYMYLAQGTTPQDVENWLAKHAPRQKAGLRDAVADEHVARRKLDQLTTAFEMLCPSRFLAAQLDAAGGRSWVYFFTRQRAGTGGEQLGAYHGAELPYVFDRHDSWLPVEVADSRLTAAMMDYWVQFARSGDPNLGGHPAWPAYSGQEPAVMELGERIGILDTGPAEICSLLGLDTLLTETIN
jgi:para-nitrobenzyl esterase